MAKKTEKKQFYLSCNIEKGTVSVDGQIHQIKLPEGCVGYSLAFTSIESLRKYYDKDTDGIMVDEV